MHKPADQYREGDTICLQIDYLLSVIGTATTLDNSLKEIPSGEPLIRINLKRELSMKWSCALLIAVAFLLNIKGNGYSKKFFPRSFRAIHITRRDTGWDLVTWRILLQTPMAVSVASEEGKGTKISIIKLPKEHAGN